MSVFKRPGQSEYSYDFRYRRQRFSGPTGCPSKRKAEEFEATEKARVKALRFDASKPLVLTPWHFPWDFLSARPEPYLKESLEMKTIEDRRNRAVRLLANQPATELQSQPLAILDDLQSLGLVERTAYDHFYNGRIWPSYSTKLTAKGRELAASLTAKA